MEGIPAALRRSVLLAGHAAACVLLTTFVLPPDTLCGQGTRQAVNEAHVVYDSARDRHQEAFAAWNRLELAVDSLIEEFERAQGAGDDELSDRLQAQLYERAGLKQRTRGQLRQLKEEWDSAGEVLKQRIDEHQLSLLEQWEETGQDPEDELLEEFLEVDRLRDEVVEEMGAPELLELPEMLNIRGLPEDTRADLERKATAYEDYAELLETLWLSRLNEQIDELTRQLQIEEAIRRNNLDIFGGRLPPVGQGGAASGGGGVGDPGPTLAQQIEDLEILRQTVIDRQRLALQRAEELRGRRGGTP